MNLMAEIIKTKKEGSSCEPIEIMPDIIFNRPDLQGKNWILIRTGKGKNVFVSKEGSTVTLHSEYMDFTKNELSDVVRLLLKYYKDASEINIPLINIRYGVWRNTYPKYIIIPQEMDGIDSKLTKKERYNLERSKKRLDEEVKGSLQIVEYEGTKEIPLELVKSFFEMKMETHNTDYGLEENQYLEKYCVDHAYVLKSNMDIIAILFSCEQCDCVYFENFTYNVKYSKWSPGMIIYNCFLNSLSKKRKKIVYIGAGKLDYKNKYDSTEEHRYYCIRYRSAPKTVCVQGYRKICYYARKIRKRIFQSYSDE